MIINRMLITLFKTFFKYKLNFRIFCVIEKILQHYRFHLLKFLKLYSLTFPYSFFQYMHEIAVINSC